MALDEEHFFDLLKQAERRRFNEMLDRMGAMLPESGLPDVLRARN